MNVLIVNDNLMGEHNAVGYSMKNMLYGMPDVNFLQYCVDYKPNYHAKMVDSIFCKKTDSLSFVLKELMAKFSQWKRKLKQMLKKKTIQTPAYRGDKPSFESQVSPMITADAYSAKGEFLRGVFYTLPCRVSSENLRKVREFKPDVIYTLAENIRVIKFAIKLSKKLGIPIVYHGMDDWKETAFTKAKYLKPFRSILYSQFEKLHKHSVENIAIGEKMAEYYSKTYGTPYTYACNCIQEYNDEPYVPNTDSMTIVFSGGLHLHRGDVLQEVAGVIEELNGEGCHISMKILAPSNHLLGYKGAFEKFPHTECRAYGFPQTDKMEQLKAADVLLHAEASGSSDVQYAKYSFSTKLPEYFAIGRCVLAYGPKELGSIKYVEDHNCGYVAENIEALKTYLKKLYENPAELESFAESNVKLGRECFSREAVQETIYGALKRSAETYVE